MQQQMFDENGGWGRLTEDDIENINAPKSWLCIDCGYNTAPRMPNKAQVQQAIKQRIASGSREDIDCDLDYQSEVYTVLDAIWEQAGMEPFGGCLCIGCLEKRLGRRLKPEDFKQDDAFNLVPIGTPRLLKRRK